MKTAQKTRIIVVDDHAMFRSGLITLIHQDPEFEVTAEAADGTQLLNILTTTPADILILDLSMPRMNGLEVLEKLKKHTPNLHIVTLTIHKDLEHFKYAMRQGAMAYLLKEDTYEQLNHALHQVKNGKKYVSDKISDTLTNNYIQQTGVEEQPCKELLTKKEHLILSLIAQGLTNKEIAVKLSISHRTVETHRFNMLRKLGVNNTAGLIKYAISQKVIE